ncbi:PTS sugar transporter subunit IIB [Clostridiales bacterium COT073_COT-073]|nr:PTS sugar transporter subunit IIB [Clostridiales bacterium COT073_COT-073]
MLKVLAACGNGMGSSMIIKMKIEKILKEMGKDCNVHHASVGEAKSQAKDFDVVIVSHMFAKDFNVPEHVKVVGLVNLLDENEIREKLGAALG